MTQSVIVANHATYGSGVNFANPIAAAFDTLAVGALLIITDTNKMVKIDGTLTSGSLADVKRFGFVIGNAAGRNNRIAAWVDKNLIHYEYKAGAAGVKQLSFVGDNGTTGDFNEPVSLVVGDEAELVIHNITSGVYATNQIERYTYVVQTGDAITDVATALVALVNANTNSIVTATDNTTGIELEAKAVGTVFQVGAGGILSAATITQDGTNNSLRPTLGVGTLDIVTKELKEGKIAFGDAFRTKNHSGYYVADMAGTAGNAPYACATFTWKTEVRPVGTVIDVATPRLVLYGPSGLISTVINNVIVPDTFEYQASTEAGVV